MPEASYSPECVEGDMKNHLIKVIDAMTHDARNDAQRALYALATGS
jgi:hypothetical protein